MKFFLIVLLTVLAGCGTSNYKKFDLSDVHESQGVIIGKVDVRFNSKPFEFTGCQFCVGTHTGTACHHLVEDGYVFMPVGKGPLTEGRLSCLYPDVCCEDIVFAVDSFEVTPEITYFGNLNFTVDIESFSACPVPVKTDPPDYSDYEERKRRGEITSFEDALLTEAIEGLVSEIFSSGGDKHRVQYKISFGVSVEDSMADVIEVFRGQIKKEDVEVQKNLFKMKLGKKVKAFQRDC